MYELSVAAKYLTPRWKQLSVSIITIISILVIAVVVWLIVVFFSVTSGLTNSWIDKLIALTAPVRITPTRDYYNSYYYLVDGISADSDYSLKTIGEKLAAERSDPYDPSVDEETPSSWSKPDHLEDGSLKDPVKLAFAEIDHLKGFAGLAAADFEMTVANLHLRLLRTKSSARNSSSTDEQQQGMLSQASYLGSLDSGNPWLLKAVVPLNETDLSNLLNNLSLNYLGTQEDSTNDALLADNKTIRERLAAFFANVAIDKLKTPDTGWRLPQELLPQNANWNVVLVMKGDVIHRILIPQDPDNSSQLPNKSKFTLKPATLSIKDGIKTVKMADGIDKNLPNHAPFFLQGSVVLPVKLIDSSIQDARDISNVRFKTQFFIQGSEISGTISYGNLQIAKAQIQSEFKQATENSPFWMYAIKHDVKEPNLELILPVIENMGEGILLPKGFRASGAMLGDAGYLSYYTSTATLMQEQRVPIFVAGFYDPGIIPIGGKYILANKQITTLIRASQNLEDSTLSNGINVRFSNREQADLLKSRLQKAFEDAGIGQYWKIETYREYEFTRDIIQQLQSEKRLYTLLATLIIIVACSNIISMLIILVNDKKLEIGILRSMGASSTSIAIIFGTCGIFIGIVGSVLGTLIALLTLKNIQVIVDFISRLQGYEMFNPLFYGETLPTEISLEALTFVVMATALISLISGIVPAVRASLLKPSVILKAE